MIDLDTAKDLIANSGLSVGSISSKYSNTVAWNQVISQDPEADSKAENNTKVNLVISKGPKLSI